MRTYETIANTGLNKGDRIHFTQKSVEAGFIWEALEDYPAENIYEALTLEGVLSSEDSSYDAEDSFTYKGYVFPTDFKVLEPGEDPLHLEIFNVPVDFEDLQVNDNLLIQGTKMSMVFPLSPESFQNLSAWATFDGMSSDVILSMLVKGTPYVLFIAPRTT